MSDFTGIVNIQQAAEEFLDSLSRANSDKTIRTYLIYIDQNNYSAATEKLYLTAVRLDENLGKPNLGKVQRRIQDRERKSQWTPEMFPRDGMKKLINYAQSLDSKSVETEGCHLKEETAILHARKQAG
jgi:hypothetical protein